MRVDLLFAFPIAAATLAERGRDLPELKKTAAPNRQALGDAEDLAFLERQLEKQRLAPEEQAAAIQ